MRKFIILILAVLLSAGAYAADGRMPPTQPAAVRH